MKYTPNSFVAVAETLIRDAEIQCQIGERSSTSVRDHRQRLECYCRPFFKTMPVRDIDHRKLMDFRTELVKRKLSSSSILCILSFVSQVLKLAVKDGIVRSVPSIPRPRQKDSPRPGFTRPEYAKLLKTLKAHEAAKTKTSFKGHELDRELRYAVTLMVNCFLRPGDLFRMKHHHIEVVDETGTDARHFLRMKLPSSKGHATPIVSMKAGVAIYRRIQAYQKAKGLAAPTDYVFLPGIENRTYAQEVFSRLFGQILDAADLRHTVSGEVRSLYSLRHYAITARLMNANGLDVVTLAKNCRTSPEMIFRFYAHWLQPEQNLDLIQSFRRKSRYA